MKEKTNMNQGYFSQTMNTFQLGFIDEKEWAGNEIIIYKDSILPFSIVTNSYVEAYQISKEDLLNKIPKDIQNSVEKFALERLKFNQNRVIEICDNVEKVQKWD